MNASIELQGLGKSFGPVRAVRAVDLSVGRGETVALLGPNGAGKSTTIDMLLGLTKPDAGNVSIFGNEPQAAIAAGEVGAMLQTGSLIPDLSVRQLVAMMAALYSRPLKIDDVLELTGTEQFAGQHTEAVGRAEPARAARPRARQ